mgnify:CR=1 FL=1|tara:strand:- start:391 stop:1968 length:1578 start_codon:yes stop_codon:yes gene_type:complete
MEESKTHIEIHKNHRNIDETNAEKLKTLIESIGLEKLNIALNELSKAEKISPIQTKKENKNYKNKTLIFDDDNCCIYQRGDTKSGIWYFRIFDTKQSKPVFKSLKTTDKSNALIQAKSLYIDYKGKIDRGETLRNINTKELIKLQDDWNKSRISDITHDGITEQTYKVRKTFLKNWYEYIDELNLINTPIHKIKPSVGEGFCNWIKNKPKQTALHTGKNRSNEYINNNVNEIKKMYYQQAHKNRYISIDLIPNLDRLKYEVDESIKRSIFTEDEYYRYEKYLRQVYCTKKHNPELEDRDILIRKIKYYFLFLMSNTGNRSKELTTLKYSDITFNHPNWNKDMDDTCVEILIRREVSKTGKSRKLVAKVKKKLLNLLDVYKQLGITHKPDDYLFLNPNDKNRGAYCRQTFYKFMKLTLISSGLKEELDAKNSKISLYTMRHQYVVWRLMLGKVNIQNLAVNIGSSVQKIESNYAHIKPIDYAEELVSNQGKIIKNKKIDKQSALNKLLKILEETDTDTETRESADL